MRTRQLYIALFAFGVLAAAPAWGSVEGAGKLPSQAVSTSVVSSQHQQRPLWALPDFTTSSEVTLLAFGDDKSKTDDKATKNPPPPPPPPKRSEKCPPGHGDDGHGDDGNGGTGGNNGHDCRVDK